MYALNKTPSAIGFLQKGHNSGYIQFYTSVATYLYVLLFKCHVKTLL